MTFTASNTPVSTETGTYEAYVTVKYDCISISTPPDTSVPTLQYWNG